MFCLAAGALVLAGSAIAEGPGQGPKVANSKQKAAIKRGLDANHMAFVQNAGQWDRKAIYRAQSAGLDYWLRNDGVTLDYHRPARKNGKPGIAGQVVKMSFVGGQSSAVHGSQQRARTAHYMSKGMGKMLSPKAYSEVTSRSVYPGIDFRSYYQKQNLRYDFVVAPKANPSEIRLKFDGASKVTVKANDLELGTQIGTFAHGKLYAYQVKDGRQVSVPARFVRTNGDVGFSLGAYDHSKPLVIDPVVYGSYYGGDNGWDDVTGVAADANGNVYMTGWTQASLFPITTGPYFTTMVGFRNAFVARLQGDAYNIDFSAFFGGSISDSAQYINVDQFGNVWISGVTNSPDFPG